MPYNSETSQYERRAATVIDATPDGDTVAVAIDVKLDQGIDDYVTDLNHHAVNGNHYPETSMGSGSRFLKQSPAGVVSWADGVVAADAALKDFSNVASGAISNDKLAPISPNKITQDASNRFTTDAEKALWSIPVYDARRGHNYIINGIFDVWQRATSQTSSGYGSADRWVNAHSGSTKATSRQAFAVGSAFPDGEICPPFYSRTVVTNVAGAGNFVRQQQRIEFVKTLAGKKATLNFYAKADAPKNIAVELSQNFGTTGIPSSEVTDIGAQKIALTTAWQRFTVVFDVPSISGKTLGSDANNYLALTFWFDAGSSFNARTDSLGGQSGTFDIANVSLVEGDIDVKPIPRSYGEELALCQRYYTAANSIGLLGRGYDTANGLVVNIVFPVTMRAAPVCTVSNDATPTITTSIYHISNYKLTIQARRIDGDTIYGSAYFTADAEL